MRRVLQYEIHGRQLFIVQYEFLGEWIDVKERDGERDKIFFSQSDAVDYATNCVQGGATAKEVWRG